MPPRAVPSIHGSGSRAWQSRAEGRGGPGALGGAGPRCCRLCVCVGLFLIEGRGFLGTKRVPGRAGWAVPASSEPAPAAGTRAPAGSLLCAWCRQEGPVCSSTRRPRPSINRPREAEGRGRGHTAAGTGSLPGTDRALLTKDAASPTWPGLISVPGQGQVPGCRLCPSHSRCVQAAASPRVPFTPTFLSPPAPPSLSLETNGKKYPR